LASSGVAVTTTSPTVGTAVSARTDRASAAAPNTALKAMTTRRLKTSPLFGVFLRMSRNFLAARP